MKVKIGDKIYSSEQEPIMLIFANDEERKRIAKHLIYMPETPEGIRRYCIYPDGTPHDEIYKFMEIKD